MTTGASVPSPDPAALREALAETLHWLEEGTSRTPPLRIPTIYDLVGGTRWALDLIEGGKEVWWCEEHKCSGEPFEVEHYDTGELVELPNFAPGDCILSQYDARPGSCQVIKRLLVTP